MSSSHRAHHEYGMRDQTHGVNLTGRTSASQPLFRASLFIWGGGATPQVVLANVTAHLWTKHGRRYLTSDSRPQIMPFDEYPKRFSYNDVLFDPTLPAPPKPGTTAARATSVLVDGHQVWGIANMGRDGANFHGWENDVCNSFGIAYYGAKWRNSTLINVSSGMVRLSTLAPISANGDFPSMGVHCPSYLARIKPEFKMTLTQSCMCRSGRRHIQFRDRGMGRNDSVRQSFRGRKRTQFWLGQGCLRPKTHGR